VQVVVGLLIVRRAEVTRLQVSEPLLDDQRDVGG